METNCCINDECEENGKGGDEFIFDKEYIELYEQRLQWLD